MTTEPETGAETLAKIGGFSWRKLLPLAVILLVAGVGFFTLRDYLSFETLRNNQTELLAFRDQNYLLTVAMFMAAYVLIVAFSLPGGAVASLTGGFLFGLFPGVLINMSAATTGAILIFLAARMGLGEALSRKLETSEGAISQIQKGLREDELSYLFLMRLIPAIPFFAANLIPALVGVRLGRFAFTTFFGIIPGALVYTWVGAGLGEVFARGASPDMGLIFEPQILGPIVGLVVLASLPIVLKKLNKKKKV
ncbi:MAG: TVP38/TMEM64 family protein [Alphaproteobacteria bacterium]|nr:TVP38/TMEM64 family protein [Alphaproteobacteria bacterium]